MSLTTIRSDSLCDNGRTCPHISTTGQGTLVVQGYLVTDPALAAQLVIPISEIAIEIPLALLPELGAYPAAALHVTDHDTVVIYGPAIIDPGILDELTIPPGEAAIEIPAAALPFLEVASRA